MTIATTSTQVRWLQVWSLASVQGAISLSWIAYAIYLPKFIEQVFEYPPDQAQQFAAMLLVIESAIAVIIEPLFGSISDFWQRWFNSRMPLIVMGAIASTALFIALPSVVIFGGKNEVTRSIFPILAVLWAVAMATFRSPVLSLLGGFAGASQLPLAASVLTLVGGFIASIRPLATKFILGLGAPITFTIATISLLGGVAALRTAMIYMPKKPVSEPDLEKDSQKSKSLPIKGFLVNLAIVILVGAAIGLGMRLLMGEVVPRTLRSEIIEFTGFSFEILMGSVLITQAILAIATGAISKLIDNKRLMMIGLGGIAVGLSLLSFGAIASMIVILFMLFCVSAINNGMVAFALTMVPKSLSGLIVGTFFSGLSWAIALFGYLVPKSATLSMPNVIVMTAIAFLTAGVAIGLGERITRNLVSVD